MRDRGRQDEGLSLASRIVGDDEDELKSDNLYSGDPMEVMFERNNMGKYENDW